MSRSQRNRRRRRGHGGPRNKALLALLVVGVVVGLAGLSVVGWVVSTAASAPPISSLKERDPGSNSEVLAADGTRLGFIAATELRQPIAGRHIPKILKDATIAIEDERFYRHKGVDYEGLIRAAVKNFASRKTVQGGSTITMQLVRNLYTADRSREGLAGYQRKIREAKLAEELENERSKEWILDKYLNTVPYGTVGGQTAIGVKAAARIYFDKRLGELDLHEAALLAGLPQAPSTYGPRLNPDGALRRRNEVLAKMSELGMVTRVSAERAMRRPLDVTFSDYYARRRESYFFDYVKDELIKEYGRQKVRLGGLRVHTTIDLEMQQEARDAINGQLGDIGPSSAIVTIDHRNGHILAMASSGDYADRKFNLAAQGHRQPGSAFKVFALMTALRQGVDPDSTTYVSRSPTRIDDPRFGPPFEIKTYSGSSGGAMNLRTATVKSDNSVYIQLALDLGPDKVAETARDMGIRTKLDGYPAESLGGLTIGVSPLEMANAYGTIASGGYRNRPTAITKVEHPDGTSELPRRFRPHKTKIFTDGQASEAIQILQANMTGGTGVRAQIGCPAGGKTGTTDRNTDAWFVGFTPRLSTSVWVGYPDERVEMDGLFYGGPVDGGTFPAAIWGAYMKRAKGKFCGDFKPPKEAFVSSPFFGKYATTGNPSGGSGDDTSTGGTIAPTAPVAPAPSGETEEPDDGNQGNGGTGFDPDTYESPPQGPPETEAPPVAPPADNGGAGVEGGDG